MNVRSDLRVELLRHSGSDREIAEAAWVSPPGDPRGEDPKAVARVLEATLKGRHGSPYEHGSMTFYVEAPIFVFREWHRHRIGWSVNEVSARYRVIDPEFYLPPADRPCVEPAGFKPMRPELSAGTDDDWQFVHDSSRLAFGHAWDSYRAMIGRGVAREVARNVLPVATYSAMHVTCNPRSMMHFLSLRTRDEGASVKSYPQWEIERAARLMEAEFSRLWPETHRLFHAFGRVSP